MTCVVSVDNVDVITLLVHDDRLALTTHPRLMGLIGVHRCSLTYGSGSATESLTVLLLPSKLLCEVGVDAEPRHEPSA